MASGLVESGRVAAVISMALSNVGAVRVKGSRVWLGDSLVWCRRKCMRKW